MKPAKPRRKQVSAKLLLVSNKIGEILQYQAKVNDSQLMCLGGNVWPCLFQVRDLAHRLHQRA